MPAASAKWFFRGGPPSLGGNDVSAARRLMNRNFVLLWQGQFVSQLGSQAFTIAMMFWLKHATGSATVMGVVMMASMIPMVVLSPIGGAIADRVSRRRVIIACDLASGVSVLSLAAVMFARPEATSLLIAWLLAVAVVGGIVRAFFMPAIKAAIPSIVPEERIAAANSLNEGSTEVSTLIGQGVGGVLFRVLGAPVLFLIDGVTYIVSAVSETFITIPQSLPERREPWRGVARAVRRELREGLSFVWAHRGMRNLMVAAAVMNFFAMPYFVLLPFYVEDSLRSAPDWYGYLLAVFGGGGIVGYSLAGSARLPGRARGAAMLFALLGVSACMAALGVAPTAWHALALMAIAGLFNGFFHVNTITLLQKGTPEELRGRVFGVLHTLVLGLAPVAMGLAGVAADALDQNVRLLFEVCGGVLLVTAGVAAASPRLRAFLADESG